ncbi:MAG: SUMF1/EgtB/PvdO family nonheme iron enzyme [Bacteroidota bacterium]
MKMIQQIPTVLFCCLFMLSCKKDETNPIQTPMPGIIKGLVTNTTGDSLISGATVTTNPPTSSVTTDSGGAYNIDNVSPGIYTVTATKGGYLPGRVTVNVVAGKTTPTNVPINLIINISIATEMILVEGSTFLMGSPNGVGIASEHPQHNVSLNSFFMGKYEVTQKLWKDVVVWKQSHGGTTLKPFPSTFNGDSLLPVESVSWNDCSIWLSYLREMTMNSKYRLPTEAEWEYAARGGINWSDNYTYSGSNNIDSVSWYYNNSGGMTHVGGGKDPNQLGIYDMSGNVWEWCADWSDANYYSYSPATNPQGPISGAFRVTRGGSWGSHVDPLMYCRVGLRGSSLPNDAITDVGFRLVEDL